MNEVDRILGIATQKLWGTTREYFQSIVQEYVILNLWNLEYAKL